MSKLSQIIAAFLKIGAIGFGGGSALIPVVEKEVVHERKFFDDETYTEHTIVANITPGALPVKLGAAAGSTVCGSAGMLAGAYAVALPGTVLTVVILMLLSVLSASMLTYVGYLSAGITAFIVFLLLQYIVKVLRSSKGTPFFAVSIGITVLCTALTCGKELREFLGVLFSLSENALGIPFFDVSTIDLLLVAFFVIFGLAGGARGLRRIFVPLLAAAYLLCAGKAQLLPTVFKMPFMLVMLGFIVLFTLQDASKRTQHDRPDLRRPLRQSVGFAIVLIVSAAVCVVLAGTDALRFLANGCLSTATSFGGGEAYLTVADGVFVGGGFVQGDAFYGQIVPVANALPGPILVKILSGIGYVHGFAMAGVAGGLAFSMLGFTAAVGTTCVVFAFVHEIYRAFSAIPIFSELKRSILPVICGLLCSTMLSMLMETLKIARGAGWHPFGGLALSALCLAAAYVLHKRFHLHDLLIILLCGGLSLCLLAVV